MKKWPILILLVILFLTLRLSVLFSYMDKLYEEEELYRGTIAREIIRGPLIPLGEYLDYKVEYFPGGTLVVGILAVPFFLLFGPSYISLKLVGLMFSLGTFILWFFFLDKFFNRRTAVLSALFFIFCTPFYAKMSLITWGAHPESNFFTILSLMIFYAIFFGKKAANLEDKTRQFFILGLVAGFAVWFVQTYFLTVLFIGLCWFGFERRFLLKKAFYIFLSGCLIGFSPGIFYQISHKGGIFSINGSNIFLDFALADINKILPKICSFLTVDLPQSFLFKKFLGIDAQGISYIYSGIFVLAFADIFWINRKGIFNLFRALVYPVTLRDIQVSPDSVSKEGLLLGYPVLFVLVYSLSNYTLDPEHWRDYIGYRYLVVISPFIFSIIAVFLDRLARLKKMALYICILSILLLLGLAGNLSLISLSEFGSYFQDKGYSYNIIGDKIGLRITTNLKEYILPFNRLEEVLRRQFYEGLGAGIGWRLRDNKIEEVVRIIDLEIEPQYQPDCYRGWGTLFAPEYAEDFARALQVGDNIKSEYRPAFYEGLGRNMNFFDNPDNLDSMDKTTGYIEKINGVYRQYCYIGFGFSAGLRLKNNAQRRAVLVNSVDKQYRKFVWQGIAQGIKES